MMRSAKLSAGEWVEVRSKTEILMTLDEHGRLEGLPFMPEMLEFCGQRFRVAKRAHKTCDPPDAGGRRMEHAVHLEGVRCNGSAHGDCQARCLIFWKEAWLRKEGTALSAQSGNAGCTEAVVRAGTRRPDEAVDCDDPTYSCQSTQVGASTTAQAWWDPRQYAEDYLSGNVRFSEMAGVLATFLVHLVATAGIGLRTPAWWIYDSVSRLLGGSPFPWKIGRLPKGSKTPMSPLDVKPGELVRIKRYDEILATVDERNLNRGMLFDVEMVPYTGGTYHVLDRVTRIINERTGKMNRLTSDCIMLEDVVCRSCYSKYRRFCPRGIYSFWREVWLERTE